MPLEIDERKAYTEDLLKWIFSNSDSKDLFTLFLYENDEKEKNTPALFDHHDDTCCWGLSLSEERFSLLQRSWQEHSLPTDLFYPSNEGHQEGWCYHTPKQWKAKEEEKSIKDGI